MEWGGEEYPVSMYGIGKNKHDFITLLGQLPADLPVGAAIFGSTAVKLRSTQITRDGSIKGCSRIVPNDLDVVIEFDKWTMMLPLLVKSAVQYYQANISATCAACPPEFYVSPTNMVSVCKLGQDTIEFVRTMPEQRISEFLKTLCANIVHIGYPLERSSIDTSIWRGISSTTGQSVNPGLIINAASWSTNPVMCKFDPAYEDANAFMSKYMRFGFSTFQVADRGNEPRPMYLLKNTWPANIPLDISILEAELKDRNWLIMPDKLEVRANLVEYINSLDPNTFNTRILMNVIAGRDCTHIDNAIKSLQSEWCHYEEPPVHTKPTRPQFDPVGKKPIRFQNHYLSQRASEQPMTSTAAAAAAPPENKIPDGIYFNETAFRRIEVEFSRIDSPATCFNPSATCSDQTTTVRAGDTRHGCVSPVDPAYWKEYLDSMNIPSSVYHLARVVESGVHQGPVVITREYHMMATHLKAVLTHHHAKPAFGIIQIVDPKMSAQSIFAIMDKAYRAIAQSYMVIIDIPSDLPSETLVEIWYALQKIRTGIILAPIAGWIQTTMRMQTVMIIDNYDLTKLNRVISEPLVPYKYDPANPFG